MSLTLHLLFLAMLGSAMQLLRVITRFAFIFQFFTFNQSRKSGLMKALYERLKVNWSTLTSLSFER